ncbi:PH domain-containing protein [Bacillus norwichensis]|uniref:PH domain-containing protein n=1 Tax=Bacillus norwichensis TaxID=2762217 RepID=A0ABR8VPS9_9BACI|nr:PH domain-containing protein [Bacillus norwichensis]MBD8006763.1 PH domain-containing protein [Bacillus norwichensis]
MFEPKRLHPITVLYDLVRSVKELILPFIFIFILGKNRIEFGGSLSNMIPELVFLLFVFFMIASIVVKWLRFTYWIEDNELRIEQGLFVKKKRYIPFDRIQSLDLSESIIHRPMGLVKVKVETAGSGGDKAEAKLTAIRKEDAAALQKILADAKNKLQASIVEEEEARREEDIIYKITTRQLLFLASTSGRAGVVISAFLAFAFQFEDFIPYEKLFNEMQELVKFGVIFISGIIAVILLIAWMLSVAIAFFKYNDFTVRKVNDELIITRGLLEKRTTTVPLHRIQALTIKESPIRQPFGYASVSLESAGGSSTDLESSSMVLLPVVKRNKVADILENYLTDYVFKNDFKPAPSRSMRRYLFVKAVIAFIIAGVLTGFFWPYGLYGAILIPIALLWGFAQYKSTGWNCTGSQLTMRYRTIEQHTMLMKKNRIQSMKASVSWFQKRAGLATVSASVKSGEVASHAEIAHLDQEDVLEIYTWYSHHERATESG